MPERLEHHRQNERQGPRGTVTFQWAPRTRGLAGVAYAQTGGEAESPLASVLQNLADR